MQFLYCDVMTVFAVADVEKGEEVTFAYTDPLDAYKERERSSMILGFSCKCWLCELDRADPRYAERENLVQKALEAHATAYDRYGSSGAIDVLTKRLTKVSILNNWFG